ncbi:MAG: CvpA family protein [Clostridia bacterium]|nr:CvpA family protein [Clostridia bacterium]
MGQYVDYALLAVLAVIVIIGFVRGFAKSLMPLRKWAALVVAWIYKGEVGELIGAYLPLDSWKSFLFERSYAMFGEKINEVTASGGTVTEESYSGIFGILDYIFRDLRETCVQAVQDGAKDVAHTVSEFISENAISLGITVVGFIAVFLVIMLGLTIILKIIDAMCGKSVLGVANRLLGALLSLPGAFITVWGITLVLFSFFPDILEGARFAEWIYNDFFLSRFFAIGGTV